MDLKPLPVVDYQTLSKPYQFWIRKWQDFFSDSVMTEIEAGYKSGDFPVALTSPLFELGIFSGGVRKENGGQGLNMVELLILSVELAKYSPGLFSSFLGNLLAQTAIERFGSDELIKTQLTPQLQEHRLLSFCVTEPQTGTDVGNLRTTAVRNGSNYIINGEKKFITNINIAGRLVVLASQELKSGRAISGFLLDPLQDGISFGPPMRKMGHRESNTGTVRFNNVKVSDEMLIGTEGRGLDILGSAISRSKSLMGGASFGMSLNAIRIATGYLSETVRFGRPLLAKADIRAKLSELQTYSEASWLLALQAATVWERDGSAQLQASMAKFFGANTAVKCVSECLELCGGSGYMEDHPLTRHYRDAKLLQIYEGASLVQLAIIGNALFRTSVKSTEQKKGGNRNAA